MDTSKEYIKMCKRAKEIQALNHPRFSYIYFKNYYKESKKSTNTDYIIPVYWAGKRNKNSIWLPTQDQLQGMLSGQIGSWHWFIYDMWECDINCERNWSGEKLWLALIMKKKHNKIWNGKKWEKID